jgi:hypothetical protein
MVISGSPVWVDHPVGRGAKLSISPTLQQVTGIHDRRARRSGRRYPGALGSLDFKTTFFILEQQAEAAKVSMRARPYLTRE